MRAQCLVADTSETRDDLRGVRGELPAVLLAFRHRKYGGIDHRSSGRIIEGAPAPPPHRCGARRRVLGVRRLVARRVGRSCRRRAGLQIAGGLGFPGFAAVSAAIAARRGRGRQRQAWLVMTFGLVALVFGAMTVLYHRFCRGSVLPLYPPAAMIGVLGLSVGRLRRIADIPVRLFGRRAFPDAVGRRDRRRITVRRRLDDAAPRCVPRDRCESPRRVSVDRLSDRRRS